MPSFIILPTFSVLLLYIPSLIGLIFAVYQLAIILLIALEKKSLALSFLVSMFAITSAVLASWFVIVGIAETLISLEYSIFDWRVALLPIMWAGILLFINKQMRK